ncbi:MAG: hypothetical protein V1749_09105 [Candidatus Desantisbacteria bacterium]
MGSLQEKIKAESLIQSIKKIVFSPNAEEILKKLTETVKDLFVLASSKKHMIGRDLGHLELTPALKHRAAYCLA